MWDGFKNYDHYWLTNDKVKWMEEIKNSNPDLIEHDKHYLWNIPCSFDIETSSFKILGKKYATMYVWSLCINGSTIVGRTWLEFVDIIDFVKESMHTEKNNLIIYVHNLAYEFQWMRKWFNVQKVFSIKERRPIYAIIDGGIEFKCSYILSNYALSYIGKSLIKKYPVKKDVGAVDYSLIRHWLTNLTDTEIWYNVHDNQVVCSYIQEKIENEGGLKSIPLTNTGYVRQYCREYCFTQMQTEPKIVKKIKARYHERMKSLQICSECEYDQLRDAFGGGFTHASPLWSGEIMYNCGSADLASSYPAVMVMKKFPMGRGTFIGKTDLEQLSWLTNTGHWCWLVTVKFKGLYPKFRYENYISSSHCSLLSKDAIINNGRVAAADECQLVVTDQDWDIISKTYDWEEVEFHNLRIYPADYLPRPFILAILNLFAKKTSLKGIIEQYTEYMVSKNMINAAYGMAVTAIIRDIFDYSNTEGWLTNKANVKDQLNSYNNSYNRFLFYGWGVWVTAYARHNLWEAILEFGKDYVYSDTDSIKGLHFEDHEYFFTSYNFSIRTQLLQMCKYWKIPFSMCQPITKDGKKKLIGVWEREEDYKLFKTIGAKRYIYEHMDGKLNFTISGVNKKFGVPYLLSYFSNSKYDEEYRIAYNPTSEEEELGLDKKAWKTILNAHNNGEIDYLPIFNEFNDGLYFPSNATGKQTLTYIDDPISCICTDYTGKKAMIYELSSIHMEPQSYFMSQTMAYKSFLAGFKDASI